MKSLVKSVILLSIIVLLNSCQKEIYYEYNIINNFSRPIAYKGSIGAPMRMIETDTLCAIDVGDTLIVYAKYVTGTKGMSIEDVIALTGPSLGALIFDDTLSIRYQYGDSQVKNYYYNYEIVNSYKGRSTKNNISCQTAYYKVDDADYQNALNFIIGVR